MNATKTNLRTTDGLCVYDLEPHAAALYAVAGPDGHDARTLAESDSLPDGFRWVSDEEWSALVASTTDYRFATDSEHGTIDATSFAEAIEQLKAMLPAEAVADGGWGWVESHYGERHYVARENM